jgi:hypothetical protein
MDPAPLILTAKLDADSFELFDSLRQAHFPPERNFLAAHVTLFHKLPGEHLEGITHYLDRVCDTREPIPITFPSFRFLGRGVAVDIDSQALVSLRGELVGLWTEHLSNQDRQKYRPHVTVQNKVAPAVARDLFNSLKSSFKLADGRITGLELWHYAGGPWLFEREFPFHLPLDRDDPAFGVR